jgi:hypothetical protein
MYYFMYFDLFNDSVSASDYMVSNSMMTVKNELGRIWKKLGFHNMRYYYYYWRGGTESLGIYLSSWYCGHFGLLYKSR